MRILILGHKGMLGRAVLQHFTKTTKHSIATLPVRYGEPNFLESIIEINPDFIINCIGKIPQKKPGTEAEYSTINTELPLLLDTLNIKIVHPTTDCEFKGDIPPGASYDKVAIRDAEDVYGKTKAVASKELEEAGKNTKIIRTSIIGHEENTSVSLLDWFLSQTGSVRGYTNHFWNGITTLEWAKQCQILIENWDTHPTLNQFGTTNHYSKFDIITLAKEIYEKDIEIIPFETEIAVNKCLVSDKDIKPLREQLAELEEFSQK